MKQFLSFRHEKQRRRKQWRLFHQLCLLVFFVVALTAFFGIFYLALSAKSSDDLSQLTTVKNEPHTFEDDLQTKGSTSWSTKFGDAENLYTKEKNQEADSTDRNTKANESPEYDENITAQSPTDKDIGISESTTKTAKRSHDPIMISQPSELKNLQHLSTNISIDSLGISELKLRDSLESYGPDKVVEYLSLNIEKLCLCRNGTKRTSDLKTLHLPRLKYLEVRGSFRQGGRQVVPCDYLVWIFRWDMPKIETIRFENVILYPKTKQIFKQFISKHFWSVKNVLFKNVKGDLHLLRQFILSNTNATVKIE